VSAPVSQQTLLPLGMHPLPQGEVAAGHAKVFEVGSGGSEAVLHAITWIASTTKPVQSRRMTEG
jgi:hypothetical protein